MILFIPDRSTTPPPPTSHTCISSGAHYAHAGNGAHMYAQMIDIPDMVTTYQDPKHVRLRHNGRRSTDISV